MFYGKFITALVNFLLIAFAVLLVVKAINSAQARMSRAEQEDEGPSEVELLSQIGDSLQSR